MQTISYKQAQDILGVKYVTIKDAVLYGRLTKCAGVTGSLLLKEQVELFRNKKISPNSLNLEERALWEEYKKIAENADLLKAAISGIPRNNPVSKTIAQQILMQGEHKVNETINTKISRLVDLIITVNIMTPEEEAEFSHPS